MIKWVIRCRFQDGGYDMNRYPATKNEAEKWLAELKERWPNMTFRLEML